MSSILKALKKLEEEKRAAQAGEYRPPRISLEAAGRPRRRLLSVWSILALVVIGGAALTGLWLARDPAAPAPAGMALESAANSSPTSTPLPVTESAPAGPAAAARPAAEQPVGPTPTSQQLSALPAEQVIEEVRFADEPVPAARGSKGGAAGRQSPTPPAVKATPAAPVVPSGKPTLVVTDVFYQAEGGGSMAVVNGLPVMEGTQVEGALVEQVLPDRVRFLIQGAIIEVPLTAPR